MFKYADYIYKIYEEQSFTQAAKKLFISQPALSTAVKRAEERLGFQIFARGTTPVTLTDAGKVYIAALEDLYKVERDLKNHVENIYSLQAGSISVSGAAFISSFILPKIIMEFSHRHPKVSILFVESNSPNLQEKLLSEEIELLVDYDFNAENFAAFPLKKEHILLAVPQKNALNEQLKENALRTADIKAGLHLRENTPCADLRLFSKIPFILLKPGNNMHKQSHKICAEHGFVPQSAIDVDQLMTAYNIAASGMGITFTTDTLVCAAADSGNLLFYKLQSPHAQRTLTIAHKKKPYVGPAVLEFIKIAQEIYGNGKE